MARNNAGLKRHRTYYPTFQTCYYLNLNSFIILSKSKSNRNTFEFIVHFTSMADEGNLFSSDAESEGISRLSVAFTYITSKNSKAQDNQQIF